MKNIIIDNDLQISWDETEIVVVMTNRNSGDSTIVRDNNFSEVCNKMVKDNKVLKTPWKHNLYKPTI